MNTCRCTSLKHPEHMALVCNKIATEPDGYCKACHDHVARDSAQMSQEKPLTEEGVSHTLEVLVEQVGAWTSKGTARSHTVFVDRPMSKGGTDRGPLGGEYLLIAAGGCFMSHLLAAIRARDAEISNVRVTVNGILGGKPEHFVGLTLTVAATCHDPALLKKLATVAERACQVLNTLKESVPISFVFQESSTTALNS